MGFAASTGGLDQYQEIRDLTVGGLTDLSITKNDGQTAYSSGETLTYTIVVTNNGPAAADGALFTDPTVAGLTVSSVTCTDASNGAVCPTAPTVAAMQGSGIAIPTFPANGSVTFTVTATVAAGTTGKLSNAASVTPSGLAINSGVSCTAAGSTYDATTGICTASDTDTPPAVSIKKTSSATTALTLGGTVDYQIVVTNTSTASASNVVVTDPLPAGIVSPTTWTCTGTNSARCPHTSGSDDGTNILSETISTLPAGGVVTYDIAAKVASSNLPVPISNTATADGPNLLCASSGLPSPCKATVTDPAAPVLQVVKTANPTTALQPGGTVVYTIVVTNEGTADATDVLVSDTLSATDIAAAAWKCTDSNGGALCPHPNGSGLALGETVPSLPMGASVTYTITATAADPVPTAGISNTATAAGAGVICQDGSASPCSSNTVTSSPASADMQGTETTVPAIIGTPETVTTSCINNGPDVALNATCTVTGAPAGATTQCTPTPPVASLAVGDSIVCTITFTPTDTTPLVITTTAGSDTPDLVPDNNTKTVTLTPTNFVPIPAPLSKLALAMLGLLVAGGVVVRMRRGSVRR